MGIFFKVIDEEKQIKLVRRKFTLGFTFIPAAIFFVLIPIIFFLFFYPLILVILLLLFLFLTCFVIWMCLEGIYYGFFYPRSFEKRGKKVLRVLGKGITIYK